jgi:murein DD-endopeptidase MepM/ murein hydrolase activator NlpD
MDNWLLLTHNPVRGIIHPNGWRRPSGNDEFRVTQDFGPSPLDVEPTVTWPGGEGIPAGTYRNFNLRCGYAVLAAREGRVAFAGIDGTGNRVVIIAHGDGFRTWYGHLGTKAVSVGSHVNGGQKIGTVGSSAATACHLHFALEINHGNGGNFEWADPWRRMMQNQTVRPADGADGVNIRDTAQMGAIHAKVKAGKIVRARDSAVIGEAETWRKWGGVVDGATPPGKTSNNWDKVWLDGAYRYIYSSLTDRSFTKDTI